LLSLAWRLIGDPRENWLCDYERLVLVTTVPSADGKLAPSEYAREVAAMLDPLHVTSAEPGDQSLRGGRKPAAPCSPAPIRQFKSFAKRSGSRPKGR
jgi:hypothetical protein